uniref:CRIB domain-containing protein n=1 Tax=Salix viminalis TaxID=40686 RepID=A0A6N2MNS2_SALVM
MERQLYDPGQRLFDVQSLTLQDHGIVLTSLRNPGSAIMTTKVKGLLRGLRYISQIFDEKEQEMQIGFPTDVKHVAHIGCDGPSATNAPSWMNEFNSPPELPCGTSNSKEEAKSLSTDPHSED